MGDHRECHCLVPDAGFEREPYMWRGAAGSDHARQSGGPGPGV